MSRELLPQTSETVSLYGFIDLDTPALQVISGRGGGYR